MTDGFFFGLSKWLWLLFSPDSLLVLLTLSAWLSLLLQWQRLARRLLSLLTLALLLVAFLPLGEWLLAPLESRFAATVALPARADGIIVLGGAISAQHSAAWDQVEMGAMAERLTTFLYLASLYPEAQLVFTGGSGDLFNQEYKEADYARFLFQQQGLPDRAIVYESESRNTAENAGNSRALVNPQRAEQWVLVTSAFHMPRAVGVFCAQNWPVTPYPVDHRTLPQSPWRLHYDFANNLRTLELALREWTGLIVYRLSGRSNRLLPGDDYYCVAESETL